MIFFSDSQLEILQNRQFLAIEADNQFQMKLNNEERVPLYGQ